MIGQRTRDSCRAQRRPMDPPVAGAAGHVRCPVSRVPRPGDPATGTGSGSCRLRPGGGAAEGEQTRQPGAVWRDIINGVRMTVRRVQREAQVPAVGAPRGRARPALRHTAARQRHVRLDAIRDAPDDEITYVGRIGAWRRVAFHRRHVSPIRCNHDLQIAMNGPVGRRTGSGRQRRRCAGCHQRETGSGQGDADKTMSNPCHNCAGPASKT